MSGIVPIDPEREALLPALPRSIASLESLQAKRDFVEAWRCDKSLIPGVIRTKQPGSNYRRSVDELATRRNTVLSLAVINLLSARLDVDDFPRAVDETCEWLARQPLKVPPGLELVGGLEQNKSWIEVLFKKLKPASFSSPSKVPNPIRWLAEVQPPTEGDYEDFLRWWNQSIAIKAMAAITAGIDTWADFVFHLLDLEYGVFGGGSWMKANPLIPTAKTIDGDRVSAVLHAHPEMCELLAFGRPMDTRKGHFWSLSFRLTDLAGDSSQGTYRSATGLTVKHIYVAALLEHIKPELQVPALGNQRDKGALMSNPSLTDAADKARSTAIQMLIDAGSQGQKASSRTARRFAPSALVSAEQEAAVRPLSLELLGFVAADDRNSDELETSIGSICMDSEKINPPHGLIMVRLNATLARQGFHPLVVVLQDDATDPDRVHLIIPDPSQLPGVKDDAEGMALIQELRRAMLHSEWALTAEPSCPEVINLGMAVALRH